MEEGWLFHWQFLKVFSKIWFFRFIRCGLDEKRSYSMLLTFQLQQQRVIELEISNCSNTLRCCAGNFA